MNIEEIKITDKDIKVKEFISKLEEQLFSQMGISEELIKTDKEDKTKCLEKF